MDDQRSIDKELRYAPDTYLSFAKALSELLYLPEDFTFFLVTHSNPNSNVYKKLKALAVLLNDRKERHAHDTARKMIAKIEETETERIIGPMTASFRKEIKEFLGEKNIVLMESQVENIDSFLYLINANYFEEIQERNSNARREFLIEQLLYSISFYLNSENKNTFDDVDAKIILKTCIFIPNDLKDRIIEEFRNSKSKSRNHPAYVIIRHDIPGNKIDYLEAKQGVDSEVKPVQFDMDNMQDCIILIKATEECKEFKRLEIGSAEDLSWDVGFIQTMMKLISTNYHDELVAIDEKCSKFNLMKSYIFKTMVYAVSNKITDITWDVAITSLASWDYLATDLRKTIIDEMFASGDLDDSKYPYETKTPVSKYQIRKIVEFKPRIPKEFN